MSTHPFSSPACPVQGLQGPETLLVTGARQVILWRAPNVWKNIQVWNKSRQTVMVLSATLFPNCRLWLTNIGRISCSELIALISIMFSALNIYVWIKVPPVSIAVLTCFIVHTKQKMKYWTVCVIRVRYRASWDVCKFRQWCVHCAATRGGQCLITV